MTKNETKPSRADYQSDWAYTDDLEKYCARLHTKNAKLVAAIRVVDVLTQTLDVRKLGGAVGQAIDRAAVLAKHKQQL